MQMKYMIKLTINH